MVKTSLKAQRKAECVEADGGRPVVVVRFVEMVVTL
jgi:hypothetical protein